jgi:hypothetical protein
MLHIQRNPVWVRQNRSLGFNFGRFGTCGLFGTVPVEGVSPVTHGEYNPLDRNEP